MTQKIYQKIKTRMRYYKRKDGYGRLIYRKKYMTFFWVFMFIVISNTIFWSSLNRADPWLEEKKDNPNPIINIAKTSKGIIAKYTSPTGILGASQSPGLHKKTGLWNLPVRAVKMTNSAKTGQGNIAKYTFLTMILGMAPSSGNQQKRQWNLMVNALNRDQDANPGEIAANKTKSRQMNGYEQNVTVPDDAFFYNRDIKKRKMDYNMKHLDDPLRGYGMTPQTVSLTYKVKEVRKSAGKIKKWRYPYFSLK